MAEKCSAIKLDRSFPALSAHYDIYTHPAFGSLILWYNGLGDRVSLIRGSIALCYAERKALSPASLSSFQFWRSERQNNNPRLFSSSLPKTQLSKKARADRTEIDRSSLASLPKFGGCAVARYLYISRSEREREAEAAGL